MENKKCEYYKCNNEVKGRKGAKFCSRGCKDNNRKMKKYWGDKMDKGYQEDLEKIRQYRELEKLIKEGINI